MRGRAFAKVNLGLRVMPPRADGLHPIVSLAQSIGWSDGMSLERGEQDGFTLEGPGPDAEENLAWRAVAALRAGEGPPLQLHLVKEVPVAAGLGGGSADAALALALAVGVLGLEPEDAVEAAPALGADVPFCLAGGTAWMEGIGDRITPVRLASDYWLGVVVPPFELSTAAVYDRWDAMGGPAGDDVGGRDLPVSLRDLGPLRNDLVPPALDLAPDLGDWRSDLAGVWDRPILMSGSGPSLFGFFPTESEAADAVSQVEGVRAARACAPAAAGWEIEDAPERFPPAPW